MQLIESGTKVDLVFSDIVMPGTIDGVGLARERSGRDRGGCAIALTTGYSDAAKAAPSNLRILRKPFDTEALRDFIQEITSPKLVRSSGGAPDQRFAPELTSVRHGGPPGAQPRPSDRPRLLANLVRNRP